MSNVIEGRVRDDSDAKTHALVAYVLMVIGLFSAIPILLGAIWAMVKKKSSLGTPFHSHFVNATRTFWWSVFWTVLGYITIPVGIGILILGLTWLWILYRMIRGLATITSDEPYPL